MTLRDTLYNNYIGTANLHMEAMDRGVSQADGESLASASTMAYQAYCAYAVDSGALSGDPAPDMFMDVAWWDSDGYYHAN